MFTLWARMTLLAWATLAAALALTLALTRTGSTTRTLTHGANGHLGRTHVCGDLTNEVLHLRRIGTYGLRAHLDVGAAQQLIGLTTLLGQHHGDDVSRGASSSGTA